MKALKLAASIGAENVCPPSVDLRTHTSTVGDFEEGELVYAAYNVPSGPVPIMMNWLNGPSLLGREIITGTEKWAAWSVDFENHISLLPPAKRVQPT